MDIASDVTALNGLNNGVYNDIECDSIEVNENAVIGGNASVGGSLTIVGSQIYLGTATFNNTVQFNSAVYGLTGGTGIEYDPISKTITNTSSSLWSLTSSNKIINQSGDSVVITREGASSKITMNYGAIDASRVGIFYNDNNNNVIEYPLITTGSLGDQINFQTPNNEGKCLIRMKPKVGSSPADDSYVVLTKPDSPQTIESDLTLGSGYTFAASFINAETGLYVGGQDYRNHFSATGGLLSYNGTGQYGLAPSSITSLFAGGTGIVVSGAGVISDSFWEVSGSTVKPQVASGVNSLTITSNAAEPSIITSQCLNSSQFAGSYLRNDQGLGGSMFVNGSTRTADGQPNEFLIRNELSAPIRVQNQYYFENSGSNLAINGDPNQVLTWGSSSNPITFTGCQSDLSGNTYAVGNYVSPAGVNVPNLNGTASLFNLVSTTTLKAFVVKYDASGTVQALWRLNANSYSDVRFINVCSNRIWVGGMYCQTSGVVTILNLNTGTSTLTLPTTGSAPNYAAWLVGFAVGTGVVDRATSLYGGSVVQYDWFSGVVEDSIGNVFACGNVTTISNAAIKKLNGGVASGALIPTTGAQQAFVIRWNSVGDDTAYWNWGYVDASFGNGLDIDPVSQRLCLSLIAYNFSTARVIPNFAGAGSSSFSLLAGDTFTTALIRFDNVTSVISPICSGRQAVACLNATFVGSWPRSCVRYARAVDKWYWASQYVSLSPTPYFTTLSGTSTFVIQPPVNSNRTGALAFIVDNSATGAVYGEPMTIWNYSSATVDAILTIRENPWNGNIHFNGVTYSTSETQVRGWYAVQSRVKFPTNPAYCGFSLVSNLNVPKALHILPNSTNFSWIADTAFPTNNVIYSFSTLQNHQGSPVYNFDTYAQSGYSIPATGLYNSAVVTRFSTSQALYTYNRNNGMGVGRIPSGRAQLEVEKGISSNTFVECRELKSPNLSPPVFSDSSGRECGSLFKAWANIDGLQAAQPVIKASVNIRYVTKISNGYYYFYFTQPCSHSNYSIFASSVGYLSNNYQIFPFINTSNTTVGYPAYKVTTGFSMVMVLTNGSGYDVGEYNVAAVW